eukprot:4844843-Pleurochrysis_carterae.AAC.2
MAVRSAAAQRQAAAAATEEAKAEEEVEEETGEGYEVENRLTRPGGERVTRPGARLCGQVNTVPNAVCVACSTVV